MVHHYRINLFTRMFYCAATLILLFGGYLFSQQLFPEEVHRDTNSDSVLVRVLERIPGTPLSLQEAINRALEEATLLGEAAAALQAAYGVLRRERGAFDPELFFEVEQTDDDFPTTNPFAGADVLKTNQTAGLGGARIKLSAGTEIEASLNASRLKTNSIFASVNPEYNAFGVLTVRQPILRGFGPSARRDLTVAEQNVAAAQAFYNDAIFRVKSLVEGLFWDLYAAERNVAVQMLIRDRAEAFVEETEVRARTGLVGPNQVANAKVFLAEQELSLIDGEEQLDQISDRLASLIGLRPDLPRFRTIDRPPLDFPVEPVESLVNLARSNNYQLLALQHQNDGIRVLIKAARWGKLPTLDLYGSLGGRGLSGTGRDIIFGNDTLSNELAGGFGDALNQVWKRDFPNWSVGININIPLGFRRDRGEFDRLEAELARAEQFYLNVERSLEEQVRAVHRALANGVRRLKAAREGVLAAEEQVRIGSIEFRNGRTTAFELVRLGEDLAKANQRYSQALVRNAKAAALLNQLTSGGYPVNNPN